MWRALWDCAGCRQRRTTSKVNGVLGLIAQMPVLAAKIARALRNWNAERVEGAGNASIFVVDRFGEGGAPSGFRRTNLDCEVVLKPERRSAWRKLDTRRNGGTRAHLALHSALLRIAEFGPVRVRFGRLHNRDRLLQREIQHGFRG